VIILAPRTGDFDHQEEHVATYTGKELATAFRRVRGNTVRIAEEIPEDKYDFRPTPETRSVARLLAHIAVGPHIQAHIHRNQVDSLAKVDFMALVHEMVGIELAPRGKAEVIALLKDEGERFASFMEGLSDDFLAERVVTPGDPSPTKSRLEMLMSAKEHEMHHRGQLMLIERMLGVVPHLTRAMQERVAQTQAAQAQK
jgi:uncharacterized damage-inducible protein DinB